jgi:hypothetical protein
MADYAREYHEGTHRIRESVTPLADGFYWKVEVTDEGLGDDLPFQPPIVFGADGTVDTVGEAMRQLEAALALYRKRYQLP